MSGKLLVFIDLLYDRTNTICRWIWICSVYLCRNNSSARPIYMYIYAYIYVYIYVYIYIVCLFCLCIWTCPGLRPTNDISIESEIRPSFKLFCSYNNEILHSPTTFCTHHDSETVVTCAKFRCERLSIFLTTAQILIAFRIRSKCR